MATKTLAQIRSAISNKLQMKIAAANASIPTSYANELINGALKDYWAMLAQAYGDDYLATRDVLNGAAGVRFVALPSDCHKILNLVWERGVNDFKEIRRGGGNAFIESLKAPETWSLPTYRLEENFVYWSPPPVHAVKVHIRYVRQPEDLVADADSFDGGAYWDRWVVLHVCLEIAERMKRASDLVAFSKALEKVETQIRSQAPDRSETDAPQIRDERGATLGTHGLRDALTLDPWLTYGR